MKLNAKDQRLKLFKTTLIEVIGVMKLQADSEAERKYNSSIPFHDLWPIGLNTNTSYNMPIEKIDHAKQQ